MTSELNRTKAVASFERRKAAPGFFQAIFLAGMLVCAPPLAPWVLAAPVSTFPLPNRFQYDPLSGFALDGFDAVSYFSEEGPQAGRPEYEYKWGGAVWRFASAANRAAFMAFPEVFSPRLGGYDADAAQQGILADADPGIYAIRQGRLYLFRHEEARDRFLVEPQRLQQAESAWPRLGYETLVP